MKAVLIGYGEVGKGLYDVLSEYHDIAIHDPACNKIANAAIDYDLVLIAIPYNSEFIYQVEAYLKYEFKHKAIVVFSTVPIGTCKLLGAIHSPIEGRHDNMAQSIRRHTRWISGPLDIMIIASKFFMDANITTFYVGDNTDATEFLKLQSLAIYGIEIEWARYCKMVMDELGGDPKLVMAYNGDYNRLVRLNGQPNYQRPLLDPPEGKIGGHCVIQNTKLLQEQFPHSFMKGVLWEDHLLDLINDREERKND